MSAPDAQPPAVPELWWSPSWGVLTKAVTGSGTPFYHHDRAGEALFDPPADAVRLVASTWAGLLSILDEHYPADVFMGGEGSDPGPRIVALAREVAQLRASAALAGTTTPTDDEVRAEAARRLRAMAKHHSGTLALDLLSIADWLAYAHNVDDARVRDRALASARALLASTPTAEEPTS